MARLQDKVTIITGGASGMGRVAARMFAAEGAKVVVADVTEQAAQSVVDDVKAAGGEAIAVVADVSKEADAKRMVDETVAAFGRVDVLYNNAGIMPEADHSVIDTSVDDWDRVMAVNVRGVFLGCKYAIPKMLEQGSGSVINISSIRGYSPNPGRMTYCAPKAAVIMMTKIAAGEWAQFGVRANAIAPGVLRTPMWDADVERGAIDEEFYLDMVPAKRLGMPAEVGALAVYLGSDDASYVNGSIIPIDGALTAIPAG